MATTQAFAEVGISIQCDYGYSRIDIVAAAERKHFHSVVIESETRENWMFTPVLQGRRRVHVHSQTFKDGVDSEEVLTRATRIGQFVDPLAAIEYASCQHSSETYVTFYQIDGTLCAFVINCADKTVRKLLAGNDSCWYGRLIFLFQSR